MLVSGEETGSLEERERLLRPLLDGVDVLAARGADAIRVELPLYSTQPDSFFVDVRDQITRNYTALLQALLEDRMLVADELSFQRRASMRRARNGFPLEDYLHGYRVGQQVIWDSIVEAAESCGADQRVVLGLASRVMRLIDFATTHAAEAYVEFRQHGLADAARSRRDLLEHLLEGRLPPSGGLTAAAERLNIAADTCALVAVASRLGDGPESEWSELASSGLTRSPLHEPSVLVVARQDEIVAVIPLVNGRDAAQACGWLERTQERLRSEGVPLAIGVSTVAAGVGELPAAYREAQAAVRFVGTEGGTAALTRLSPFEYLTLNADPTALRLIHPRVQAFLASDLRRGGVMVATLRAYAETDLSLKATAAALHVHPNTAQYRFQRVEELTGLNPRSFEGLHTLLVAVELTDAHPSQN